MNSFSRSSRLGLVFLMLSFLLVDFPARAQVGSGPIVKEITVEFVGPPAITKERVLANLATQVGEPYSERAVEEDIRALYATGAVSNVRLFAEPFGDGVKVTVLLQGRPTVSEVLVEGPEQIKTTRVRREIASAPGDLVSEEKLEDDRRKILKLYEDRFYAEVTVEYKVEELPGNKARVLFSISEGPKLVVRKISFVGNEHLKAKELRAAMKTKQWNVLSFFTKSGRLLPQQLEDDRDGIRLAYQNKGYADVQITDVTSRPLDNGKGVEITVTINEGVQYSVNSITFEGVQIVSPEEIKATLKMNDGSLYTPKGMAEDIKAIRDFYGTRGYVDMLSMPEVLPAGPGAVDITYRIDEGIQSYVNLVSIQGNTRTKDRVIRRELAIKPGDVLDSTRVDISRQRLQNLNYFSRVEMVPQNTLVPGRKDLNVIVEEQRTGSFNFGVGFSTIDSLLGFAEIQQSNFDIFNWPRLIGGGQRFRIRAQYGLKRRDFVISLTEPWFLGYKLSAGIEGFYRDAFFLSPVYNQSNLGAAAQLRKALTNFLSIKGEYRIEQVRIFDVDDDHAGIEIQEAAGTYNKSAVSGALTWDSRDNFFLPRKGEVVELSSFIAGGGLGGNVQDYGLTLEASKYVGLPFDLIFSVRGQLAVVDSWGSKNYVPLFDRLYLGGATTMRGFDFRDVSPKDRDGNPIGGGTLGFISTELTFPIIPKLRGAFFFDAGYVNSGSYDFSFANYNADVGVGLRIELPIGPIRLDYGIPVKADQYNRSGGKFNLNIGYQF